MWPSWSLPLPRVGWVGGFDTDKASWYWDKISGIFSTTWKGGKKNHEADIHTNFTLNLSFRRTQRDAGMSISCNCPLVGDVPTVNGLGLDFGYGLAAGTVASFYPYWRWLATTGVSTSSEAARIVKLRDRTKYWPLKFRLYRSEGRRLQ